MSNKSYYDILQVEQNATLDAIKRSFRRLSMEHHPDKNGNSEESNRIFKDINEAYSVLSDTEKRTNYDFELQMGNRLHMMGGMGGMGMGSMGMGGMGMGGMGMGGMGMGGMGMGGMGMGMGINPIEMLFSAVQNQSHQNSPGLFEAIFGGVGGSPHIVIHNFTQTMNESPISEQFDVNMVIGINLCDAYNGITQYEHINYYESEKNGSQTEKIIITIPPSMPDGYMLQIKNKGNVIPKSGGRRGSLNLEFNIQTHDVFKREGDDLLIEHKVSLKDALCGFTFDMLHLNGRSYKMSCKPCSITNNEIKLLPGLGYNSNGTLKIKFLVELPTELSKEQIDQLSNIL